MQFRTLVLSLTLVSACDCSEHAGLEGPSLNDIVEVSASSVSSLGLVPFDVDRNDLVGPGGWDAQYGKTPEIIVAPGDGYLDALVRSTDETTGPHAFLVRLRDSGASVSLERAFEVPSLGLVLGFARADDGSFYYATGSYDDDISRSYPGKHQHRSNVVRVYHASSTGEILFDVDLDRARAEAFPDSEPLVNPAVASSARLAVANGTVALVAGNNTAPDGNGTRHQKAVTTLLDAATGAVIAPSSIWVSHSFDERYLVDGSSIYELHLGDAYPRQIVLTKISDGDAGGSFRAYSPKGNTGHNNTFTRLGSIARVTGGANDGKFVVLYSTERTSGTDSIVSGARDLALTRLIGPFATGDDDSAIDTSLGTSWDVSSGGDTVTNRAVFLTSFDASGTLDHAERPKLVALPGGEFLVLYEHWTRTGNSDAFDGTYAMRIDSSGSIVAAAKKVSTHHLPRGDDAFAYGGGIAWLTGDEVDHSLTLHRVSAALSVTESVVP